MARRKNAPESIRVKHGLSDRLRSLRTEFYGERGGPDLARTLGIPVRTWYNYENGVTVPAEIILRIVELTSVEPVWLLRGDGPKYRETGPNPTAVSPSRTLEGLATSPITTLLRVALERLEEKERTQDPHVGSPIITRREKDGGQDLPSSVDDEGSGLDETTPEPLEPGPGDVIQGEYFEGRRAYRSLRVADDSMAPIVAEGAHVAYGEPEPISEAIDEKLVVAWIEGKAVVRWFQHCGKFALLRAENPTVSPPTTLIELDRTGKSVRFHRVLWISTPH
jgi:Peptidase S24-like